MQLKFIYIFFAFVILFFIYSTNIYLQPSVTTCTTNSPDFIKGRIVWQKYNCQTCHQLYGLGGYLGPDLTNEISKPNSENIVKVIVQYGVGSMPAFKLSNEEQTILINFLIAVNQTGNADPRSFKSNLNGTIDK